MIPVYPVGGAVGGECSLLVSPAAAILFDSGFPFSAGKTLENIRAVLGSRPLDAILASHTHYDHIGASPVMRRAYPALQVYGSAHARSVLSRDGARDVIRSLNDECARDRGMDPGPDLTSCLAVDRVLDDGEEIRIGDVLVRAVATPGHTRCAMSYYLPEERFLLCSETAGVAPTYPEVTPCMIIGFAPTLDSIIRMRDLRAERVLIPHSLVIEGRDEVDAFFANAEAALREAVDMLLRLHGQGCGEDEIVEAFFSRFHVGSEEIQPRRAFDLNTRALIPRILAEMNHA